MKNKKGFTLVELMAVIVVLAIIIAIAVPVYNKIQKSINENNYKNKVELIKVAASKYAEDTHYETMYVDDLITSGYLDADNEKGEIFNNVTKEKINCYIVQVTLENGTYYAKLIETTETYNNGCPSNIPNDYNKILTIKMINATTNEEITKENSYNWWTNSNVKLKADVKLSEEQSIEKIEWYEGGFSEEPIPLTDDKFKITENENNDKKEYLLVSTDSVLQQNYIVRVTLSDGKIYNSVVRVYIDKIKPKFYKNDGRELDDEWVTEITYRVKAYDNESGIYGYKLEESETCSTDKEEYKTKKIDITDNGTYKICLMDNAGNVYAENRDIDKIDNVTPSCTITVSSGTAGNLVSGKQYYKSDVVLKLETSTAGLSGISAGLSTNSASTNTTESVGSEEIAIVTTNINSNTEGTTYYGYVKTGSGKTATCSYTLYLDKTAPTCTSSGGSTSWTNDSRTLVGTCSDTGGSGCANATVSGRTYKNGNVSWTINWQGSWSNLSPGTVYDNAGNSTTCPADQTAKVDLTAPTCTSSGGSTSWTNDSRTLVGTCSDTGGSGCANATVSGKTYKNGNVSWTINWQGSWSSLSPGTVYDNAGNSTPCPADQTVKVDLTAPTCKISKNLADDKQSNTLTINATESDSGLATKAYSWNNTKYIKSNTKTVSENGTYTAYVKDVAGNIGSCNNDVTGIKSYLGKCNNLGGTHWIDNSNTVSVSSVSCNPTAKISSFTYNLEIDASESPYGGGCWFTIGDSLANSYTVTDCTGNMSFDASSSKNVSGKCTKSKWTDGNEYNISERTNAQNTIYMQCYAGVLGVVVGSFEYEVDITYFE